MDLERLGGLFRATEDPAPAADPGPDDSATAERAGILEYDAGVPRDEAELIAAAGEDWPEIENDPAKRAALRGLLDTAAARERGEVPPHYTKPARCAWCGPIWLWEGAPSEVFGCPWCANRARGRRIPRPPEC